MKTIGKANQLIEAFQEVIEHPKPYSGHKQLYSGVDLGTAYTVLAVVDEDGAPVAGAMRFAQVVRDGLVVDYHGAVEIVGELKAKIENSLDAELLQAGIAYPPGTSEGDQKAFRYIAEAVGFEVAVSIDEPSAANNVLNIENGAVVDIGGGTTGIAIIEDGRVAYLADEPTGGVHVSLVISGACKIPFEKAEKLKNDSNHHQMLLPTIKPVIEKFTTIIRQHIQNRNVDKVFLVGGTGCFTQFETIIEAELHLPVIKPANPFLVTPLGIALEVTKACS
ncbi:ethanolamine utilization protein EutJ [Desulfitobacterium sp. PCE1]|uniref:ethanolamine utilization protein EutJ n=1 Tax=Desulfitobacterium sp. PCE1 TaxID=146907 RepID=UPI00037D09C6|nr:ethanolamine utilization protein EutJ [Desulfitobacterium sp. PCE1]